MSEAPMSHALQDEATRAGEGRQVATPPADLELASADTQRSGDLASAPTLGSDAAPRRVLPVAARVGRYLVIDRLGAGGMGVVLAAYDPDLDRKVALKLLRAGPSDEASARLLREAQALARLSHPNVVQIHDAGAHGDQVFLAMELVDGDNLRRWLDAGPRPWRAILRVFVEAGRGLAAAHAAGIVHRDFKPENVLISKDGRARVADFGLARQAEGAPRPTADLSGTPTALDVSLTISGTLLGTPAYMSPEHFDGARADARSDIFSFCVALYEALYGRRPFTGDTLPNLLDSIRHGRVAEPPAGTAVPRRIFAILRRGLACSPDARPASMEAVLADLTYDPGARRRTWALGAGLVLAASAATRALAPAAAPDPCTGNDAALADLWNDTIASSLSGSLALVVRSPAVRDRVLAGLDAYADAWSSARTDACLDHRRGDDSDAVRDARTRCLDRRRSALDGALRLLRDARPGDDVVRVVAGLPALDACARVDSLLAGPATDPDRSAALDRRLDDVRALTDAGRLDDADTAARAAIDAAGGDRVLLARSRLALARVDMTRASWLPATTTLRLALADALAGRDDATAAEVVARLLYTRALTDREPAEEILAEAPIAEALVDRAGPDGFAQRRLRANLALVHVVAGDLVGAREQIAAATADLASVVDADPLESANFLRLLAAITDDPARRRDAYDRAEAQLSRLLGDDHPELLGLRFVRGRTARDLAEADAALATACPGLRAAFPGPDRDPTCIECSLLRGQVAEHRGDLSAAITHLDDAITCSTGTPADDRKPLLDALRERARARVERLRGRPDQAIATAARTTALLTPRISPDDWPLEIHLADLWLVEGEAHRDRGDLPAARAALERSHDALTRLADRQTDALPHYWRARAAELLAELLEPDSAERPRARALAAAARDFHAARGPAGAAQTAALDAWLAAHP